MFAPFLIIYEIDTNQIKYGKLDLEIEGQVQREKGDVRKSNRNNQFHIDSFVRILAAW